MLNLTREQATRLFFALVAVLVILFLLILWLLVRTAAPSAELLIGLPFAAPHGWLQSFG